MHTNITKITAIMILAVFCFTQHGFAAPGKAQNLRKEAVAEAGAAGRTEIAVAMASSDTGGIGSIGSIDVAIALDSLRMENYLIRHESPVRQVPVELRQAQESILESVRAELEDIYPYKNSNEPQVGRDINKGDVFVAETEYGEVEFAICLGREAAGQAHFIMIGVPGLNFMKENLFLRLGKYRLAEPTARIEELEHFIPEIERLVNGIKAARNGSLLQPAAADAAGRTATYSQVKAALEIIKRLESEKGLDAVSSFFIDLSTRLNWDRRSEFNAEHEKKIKDMADLIKEDFASRGFDLDNREDVRFLYALMRAYLNGSSQARNIRFGLLPSELRKIEKFSNINKDRENMQERISIDGDVIVKRPIEFLTGVVFNVESRALEGGKTVSGLLDEYLRRLPDFVANGISQDSEFYALGLKVWLCGYRPFHESDIQLLLERIRKLEHSVIYVNYITDELLHNLNNELKIYQADIPDDDLVVASEDLERVFNAVYDIPLIQQRITGLTSYRDAVIAAQGDYEKPGESVAGAAGRVEDFLRSGGVCGLVNPSSDASEEVVRAICRQTLPFPGIGVEVAFRGGNREETLRLIGAAVNERELSGGNVTIAAGTVLNIKDALDAIRSGAELIVTPGITLSRRDIVKIHNTGAKVVIGVGSVSEAREAVRLGADAVKVFPYMLKSGDRVDMHKAALKGPLPLEYITRLDSIKIVNSGNFPEATFTNILNHLRDEGRSEQVFKLPLSGRQLLEIVRVNIPEDLPIMVTGGVTSDMIKFGRLRSLGVAAALSVPDAQNAEELLQVVGAAAAGDNTELARDKLRDQFMNGNYYLDSAAFGDVRYEFGMSEPNFLWVFCGALGEHITKDLEPMNPPGAEPGPRLEIAATRLATADKTLTLAKERLVALEEQLRRAAAKRRVLVVGAEAAIIQSLLVTEFGFSQWNGSLGVDTAESMEGINRDDYELVIYKNAEGKYVLYGAINKELTAANVYELKEPFRNEIELWLSA